MTFQELGLNEPILRALADQGYEQPSPIQAKAIPPALTGRDVLGCAQTGTGKTCAFAAPILQQLSGRKAQGRPIRALILTPTRELALQIQESFEAYGKYLPLRSTVIFGGVGQAPQVERLKKGVDILVATPGRLGDLYGQKLIDLSRLEIFVLDEADRMLDMGFIHDVRRILGWLPAQKQTLFFSATMPPEVQGLVDSLLHNPVKVAVDPISSPVEVIDQKLYYVDRGNKTRLLAALIRELGVKNALVFTRTKHGANKVAGDLVKAGISAAAIHGNKSQTARQQALADFKSGAVQVLVATDIAARGLDIEELSYVFNYNLSEVPETYIHRIGRTGRAGRGGTAISFCDYGEMPMLKDIEKLLKKPIPRRAHDYPMEVFEVPVKDAKGRVVNPEDAEARQAAREKHAAQRKQAAEKAAEKAAQPLDAPADPAPGRKRRRGKGQGQAAAPQPPAQPPEKGEKARRTFPHGKQNLGNLEDFLAAQPVEEGAVSFSHRDPLEGEVIMDATARLLAAKPVYQYYKPGAAHGKRGKGDKKPKAQAQPAKPQPPEKTPKAAQAAQTRKAPKKGAPAPAKKGTGALGRPAARSGRGRGRIPPRVEPPKSRQKDSTEQKSLMKPFYIDHD